MKRIISLAWACFFATCAALHGQQAPTITAISSPRQVVAIGHSLELSVEATGSPAPTFQWKRKGRPIPGATSPTYTINNASPITDTGWYHVVVANSNGATRSATIFVNVSVSPAQILTAGNYGATSPQVPSGLTDITGVAAGAGHWLALKSDGTVVAWGYNAFGQATVPAGLDSVVAIACNTYSSLALKSDGTVVAWGDSSWGQRAIPAGLANVVKIASGQAHTVALRADGTVVAWGFNSNGQSSPPPLANVIGVAAGTNDSFAWKEDGTATGWGDNTFRQTSITAGIAPVADIVAGDDFSIALRTDGTLVGQNTPYMSIPDGLNNVVAIAAGANHVIALKADGTIVAWGDTYTGPVIGPNAANVVAIAANDAYSIILRHPLATIAKPGPSSESLTVASGSMAVLSADTVGAVTTTFQWLKDGAALPGATNRMLVYSSATAADAGLYYCVVTDTAGSHGTGTTRLDVSGSAAPSRIVNLSTRAPAGTNAQTLILGFVVSGAPQTTTPVLLRAIGPALADFNLPGLLADPKFDLFAAGTKIDAADNWEGDSTISSIGASVGAFSLADKTSKDAALYLPAIAPGVYTMQVSGAGGSTGVALAEIYDATRPGQSPTSASLANASARAQVGTGNDLLIVGFVIAGDAAKTVLIRAAGPSLRAQGVTDVLVDPKLELYGGATRISENDNWTINFATLSDAFARVGAAPFPANSTDAALLVTLPPGVYTAQASGVGSTTGVALLELYELP